MGKTAFYDPNMMKITLFVDGRHVKDIMRSLSHEMVHHTQNCQGKFSSGINTGPGYAQNDEHLRNQEKQAYLVGNIRFRDWEDGIKQQQENKKVKNKNLINEIVELIQEEVQNLEEALPAVALAPLAVDAMTAGAAGYTAYDLARVAAADKKAGVYSAGGEKVSRGQGGSKTGGLTPQEIKAMLKTQAKPMPWLTKNLEEEVIEESPIAPIISILRKSGVLKDVDSEKLKNIAKKLAKLIPGVGAIPLEEGEKHDCDEAHPNISHKVWEEKQEKLAEAAEVTKGNIPPHWEPTKAPTNENWFKGDKDQLLFEELTRKWTKKR